MFDGLAAPWHAVIIAVLFVVLFGAKRLPDPARAVGQSLRTLRAETRGLRTGSAESAAPPVETSMQPPLPPGARYDPYTGQR